MSKKTVSAKTRRQFVVRSTKASARVEQRVVPSDHVENDHLDDLTRHLVADDAGELLLVPVGAGHEAMG